MAWKPAMLAVSYLIIISVPEEGLIEMAAVPILAIRKAHNKTYENAFPIVFHARISCQANRHLAVYIRLFRLTSVQAAQSL